MCCEQALIQRVVFLLLLNAESAAGAGGGAVLIDDDALERRSTFSAPQHYQRHSATASIAVGLRNKPHRYGNSHAICRITQCYLLAEVAEVADTPALHPAEAGTRLSDSAVA